MRLSAIYDTELSINIWLKNIFLPNDFYDKLLCCLNDYVVGHENYDIQVI